MILKRKIGDFQAAMLIKSNNFEEYSTEFPKEYLKLVEIVKDIQRSKPYMKILDSIQDSDYLRQDFPGLILAVPYDWMNVIESGKSIFPNLIQVTNFDNIDEKQNYPKSFSAENWKDRYSWGWDRQSKKWIDNRTKRPVLNIKSEILRTLRDAKKSWKSEENYYEFTSYLADELLPRKDLTGTDIFSLLDLQIKEINKKLC